MLPAAVHCGAFVVVTLCILVQMAAFSAAKKQFIIKPKIVAQNYYPGTSPQFYTGHYSEYNFKLAQLNFTNEKIAIACCKRKTAIAVNVCSFVKH